MKALNKILDVVSLVLGIFIITILVYVIGSKIIFKKSYPNLFGYTYMQVKTGSMAKKININDIVIIKLNAYYNVGDVITFEENNYFITHRVVSINGDKILTKGDTNNVEDEEINSSSVVGKVVKTIPESDYNLVKNICIGVIVVLIIYQLLRGRVKP